MLLGIFLGIFSLSGLGESAGEEGMSAVLCVSGVQDPSPMLCAGEGDDNLLSPYRPLSLGSCKG